MLPRRRFVFSFMAFAAACFLPRSASGAAEPADPLATLRAGHPRLLVSADTWPRLRELLAHDADFRAVAEAEIATARARFSAPAPERKLEGIRLLHVSRRVLADAVSLSLAYRLTGDRAFLDVAERNLLAAAAFSDWHPDHFLDVGEMTAGVALGYDWLHDDLSPATRATLRAAIADKGIRPGLDPDAKHNWWHTRKNNWNQVCLGGLTLGALAIAEDEPALAREMLDLLRRGHGAGLAPYAPDGIYPEGPNYWRYGTAYTVLTLAALDSALGDEKLLPAPDCFFAGARVQSLLIAPSGMPYNFADGGRGVEPDPLLFWFAGRAKNPSLLAGQRRFHTPYDASAWTGDTLRFRFLSLLNWQMPPAAAAQSWTAWHGGGPVPLAVFRGPDAPRGAFYLGLKGGSAGDSHAHMDAGSFVFELDGVRWAHDLGMQEYHALEERGIHLFDGKPGGDRWKVFRYTNQAHNTLTLDDAPHAVNARVSLSDFSADPARLGVSADLSPLFASAKPKDAPALRVIRRFSPRADARGLEIVDELEHARPGARLRWTLVTHAAVELAPRGATLREAGRELLLRVTSPADVALSTASASGPADFDAAAPGFTRILIDTVVPADGAVRLATELRAP